MPPCSQPANANDPPCVPGPVDGVADGLVLLLLLLLHAAPSNTRATATISRPRDLFSMVPPCRSLGPGSLAHFGYREQYHRRPSHSRRGVPPALRAWAAV